MGMLRAFLGGFSQRIQQEGAAATGDIIKEPPMQIDGRCMTADEFAAYVEGLSFPQPLPTRIFLHHTWKPTVEDWRGHATILSMKAYYEKQCWVDAEGKAHEGWNAGPHLFGAPDGIWLFSDLREDGVGVYGNNYRTRHLEIVGNYDQVRPSGAVLENTIAALGILHHRLGLDARNLAFHRDFSSKSCPGWAVRKEWIIPQVTAWIEAYRRAREATQASLRRNLATSLQELLKPMNPQAALAVEAARRGLLGAITDEIPMEIDEQGYIVQAFAEVLLVPVSQWDRVRSLRQHEQEQAAKDAAGAPAESGVVQAAAPPTDPYHFTGQGR
jgi:hypothetical protein